ncbi:omwaprin-a-like [Anomaloglossus baeobatrachus]|uniref:omwaprin-a-like n=1 Tax=Anomaloglossus baeobatrachus TaxID=238106 RepID=UPI003F50B74F
MSPVKVSFLLLLFLCSSGYPTSAVPFEYIGKPGNCPEENPAPLCNPIYVSDCGNDYECSENQKCCVLRCKPQCTYPIFY